MKQNRVLIASIVVFVLVSIITIFLLVSYAISQSKEKNNSQNTQVASSYPNNGIIPVSNSVNQISYLKPSETIKYNHSSGKISYEYPSTWEFLPERQEMGLIPKEYSCPNTCYNEIVTILYFANKGQDVKNFASLFDGGYPWEDITVNNNKGIYYNYVSENLDQKLYWFSDGTDAVKIMFRKYNKFSNDGHDDNSRFENDFKVILNSFRFVK